MDYTTREMIEAIEISNPMKRFFSATFFNVSHTHTAAKIEVDIKKGKRRMAPFVAPRVGGKVISRDGFTTNTFTTPKIAPERIMTLDDITKRGLGENLYSKKPPEERADELLSRDLNELDASIENRKEWMARELLFKGKIDIVNVDEGVDIQVDYNFTNNLVLSGSECWGAGGNILNDLRQWRRDIIRKTGNAPDMLILAPDVAEVFTNDDTIKASMDILNLKNVVMEPKVVDSALTFLGKIAEIGIEVYTYDEWFINDDDEEESMIPDGTLLLINSKGVGSFEYGAVTIMEENDFVTYEAEKVPKIINDTKNEIKLIRMTSRPLPIPFDVDSWYTVQVI